MQFNDTTKELRIVFLIAESDKQTKLIILPLIANAFATAALSTTSDYPMNSNYNGALPLFQEEG